MKKWIPQPGAFAIHAGRSKNNARMVRIVAEASGGYMCVEAVGRKGANVQFSVKRDNLREPERSLFD